MKLKKKLAYIVTAALIASSIPSVNQTLNLPFIESEVYAATNPDLAYVSTVAAGNVPVYCYPSKNIDWSKVPSTGLFPLKKYWQKPTQQEFYAKAKTVYPSLKLVEWDPTVTSAMDLAKSLSGDVLLAIKDGVTDASSIGNIGGNVNGGPCVKYIYFPESVTKISTLKPFKNVKEVILSSKITNYAAESFSAMDNLECLVLPPVAATCDLVFDDDLSLRSLVNPGTYGTSGIRARGCSQLTYISDPEGITYVNDYALYETKATSYKIPSTVKTIGYYSFSNCAVAIDEFPEGLKSISMGAFKNNSTITKMILPSTCVSLGAESLKATNIREIAYKATEPITFGNNFVPTVSGTNYKFYGYTESDANESIEIAASKYGWQVKHITSCSDISFTPPSYVSHTITPNEEKTQATVTVKYSDSKTPEEDLLYSFNGGEFSSDNTFVTTKNGIVKVKCKDHEGNVSSEKEITVAVIEDTVKPVIEDISISYDSSPQAILTFTVSDNMDSPADLKISYDNGVSYNHKATEPLYVVKNGTYSYTCKDSAGNISDEKTITISSLTDNKAPVISKVDVEVDPSTKSLKFIPTATDNWTASEDLVYSTNGVDYSTAPLTGYTDGNYTLTAKDEAGNISSGFAVNTTKLSEYYSTGTSPSISSLQKKTSDGKSNVIFDNINLGSGNKAASGISTVKIGYNGTTTNLDPANWSFDNLFNELTIKKSYLATLSDDDYSISVVFDDYHNTVGAVGKITVEQDGGSGGAVQPPATDTTSPTVNGATVSELSGDKTYCTITINASDDKSSESQLQYSLDGISWSTSKILKAYANGTYQVQVKDEAGNISTQYPVIVDKFTVTPPSSAQDKQPSITAATKFFDLSNPKTVFISGVDLGSGAKKATGITTLALGSGEEVPTTKWDFDVDSKEITISKDYLKTLAEADLPYKIYATFNDSSATRVLAAKIDVSTNSGSGSGNITPTPAPGVTDTGLAPSTTVTTATVDKYKLTDISLGNISLGSGDKKATKIETVSIGTLSNIIDPALWVYDKDFKELTIDESVLRSLATSDIPYKVYVKFNDADNTVLPAGKITVKDTTPFTPTGTAPSVVSTNATYNGSDDIEYTLVYGSDDYACDGVKSILVNGSSISRFYYKVSGDKLVISKDYLDCLQQGPYTVSVIFNDKYSTKVEDDLGFKIPKKAENTGWVNEDTSILNVLWNRSSARDLNIPLNNPRNVISVTADSTALEAFVYNTSTGILTIPVEELNRLSLGTHSFVVKFAPASIVNESRSLTTYRTSTLFMRPMRDELAEFDNLYDSVFAGISLPTATNPLLGIVTNIVDYGSSGLTYQLVPDTNNIVIIGNLADNNSDGVIEIPDTINNQNVVVQQGAIPQSIPVTGGEVAKEYSETNGNNYVREDGVIEKPATDPESKPSIDKPSSSQTTSSNVIKVEFPDFSDRDFKQSEIDSLKRDIEDYKSKQKSLEKELQDTKISLEAKVQEKIPYILSTGSLDDVGVEVKAGINEIKIGSKVLGKVYGISYNGHLEDYTDVSPTDWYYFNIMTCARNNILPEIDAKTFMPKANITKGDAIKAIAKMIALKSPKVKLNRKETDAIYNKAKFQYKDSEEEYYIVHYMISLYGEQAVSTMKFIDSREELTRQSLADISYSLLKDNIYTDTSYPNFKDVVVDINNTSIRFITCSGLLKGDDKGYFKPESKITRAEFATYLSTLYFKL